MTIADHRGQTGRDDASGYRVIVFGRHSPDWMLALGNTAEVWKRMGNIRDVVGMAHDDPASLPADDGATVILPLMEPHMLGCPRAYRSLFADPQSVMSLADKSAFAAYAVEHGLEALCPGNYTVAEAAYPCVLKRVDLNGAAGITLVRSEAELQELLAREPWLGKPCLIQAYVASEYDHVTHAVYRNGSILWHRSYRYRLDPEAQVRRPGMRMALERIDVSDDTISQLDRFMAPLNYNGPMNFDYRFAGDGSLKVIEINPRLGGSLMRPANVDHLAEALTAIVENAL